MALIINEPFIRCDRCGLLFSVSSYHSRLLVRGGFDDLTKRAHGAVITARDLCAICERKLIEWLDEPTNTEPMEWEDDPREER